MTTASNDRYTDLTALSDSASDPALARLLDRLDVALRPRPAPPVLRAALDRLLHERIGGASVPAPTRVTPAHHAAGGLSRRGALKVAAASMAWLLTLGQTGPEVAEELVRLAQQGPMTGPRLIGLLDAERTRWHALLAEVGAARMEEPGVEGTWSVKELIAHLTFYERRIVEGARQVLVTGRFSRPADDLAAMTMDERNEVIAAQARVRPVADVLAEADQVFGQLCAILARAPTDLLNDPRKLGIREDEGEDVAPWMRVANNSYGHYRQHEQAIRDWLERTRQGGQSGEW